ncbi:transcriptional regulator, LacI family [Lachnospiraceae bacterium KH1T2]|nr:transcriptional regulator, LacI family [Lachnospiraceae bacterium KH1T2]
MATIKEVAKECGVSIATVSNALNGTGRASKETKERIIKIAKDMGYVPDLVARNLKQKRTKVIGIITEDITVFNTVGIVDGIHEYLEKCGYSFLLGNLRLFRKYDNDFYKNNSYVEAARKEFRIMESQRVAGVIYVGAHCREINVIPKNYKVPTVIAYGYGKAPSVLYDDEEAAYEAVEQLINSGAKNIGMILGEQTSLHTIERRRGFERAMFDHKLLMNPNLIEAGNWHRRGGYEAGKKILSRGADAIFSMSDIMSVGVYDYAYENNLKIGKDFSIVSFDNREISAELSPGLSTMAIPLTEIGRVAAQTMIGLAEDTGKAEGVSKLRCSFLSRGSVMMKIM